MLKKHNLYESDLQLQDQWAKQATEELKLEEAAEMEMDPALEYVKLVLDLPHKEHRAEMVEKKRAEFDVQQHFRDLLRDMDKLTKELHEHFKTFDKDNTGKVDMSQLGALMKDL